MKDDFSVLGQKIEGKAYPGRSSSWYMNQDWMKDPNRYIACCGISDQREMLIDAIDDWLKNIYVADDPPILIRLSGRYGPIGRHDRRFIDQHAGDK